MFTTTQSSSASTTPAFECSQAWKLAERNCWPDFAAHYGLCCQQARVRVRDFSLGELELGECQMPREKAVGPFRVVYILSLAILLELYLSESAHQIRTQGTFPSIHNGLRWLWLLQHKHAAGCLLGMSDLSQWHTTLWLAHIVPSGLFRMLLAGTWTVPQLTETAGRAI